MPSITPRCDNENGLPYWQTDLGEGWRICIWSGRSWEAHWFLYTCKNRTSKVNRHYRPTGHISRCRMMHHLHTIFEDRIGNENYLQYRRRYWYMSFSSIEQTLKNISRKGIFALSNLWNVKQCWFFKFENLKEKQPYFIYTTNKRVTQ